MDIKTIAPDNIRDCAQLMLKTYNCAPWNDNWTIEAAEKYLSEFFETPRFTGFILVHNDKVVGAIFCHEQTWWTQDELYIDEFFISPDHQNKGFGKALLEHIEQYSKERELSGITLLTSRNVPASEFYKKNGFQELKHIAFMFKKV